jgi:hypothetical protein
MNDIFGDRPITYTDIWYELVTIKKSLDTADSIDLIRANQNITPLLLPIYQTQMGSIIKKHNSNMILEKEDVDFMKGLYLMYYTTLGYDVDGIKTDDEPPPFNEFDDEGGME